MSYFLCYTDIYNDISNVPKYSKIILFADDTALKISGKDMNQTISNMNKDLDLIYNWLNHNKT